MSEARENRFLVDREIGQTRHIDDGRVRELRVVLVHRKRRRHVEEHAPRPSPCERQAEQQLVTAVAREDLIAVKAIRLGDKVAQLVGQRIGIAVEGHLAHGALDFAAQLEGHITCVLVRRDHDLGGDVLWIVRFDVRELWSRRTDLFHGGLSSLTRENELFSLVANLACRKPRFAVSTTLASDIPARQ